MRTLTVAVLATATLGVSVTPASAMPNHIAQTAAIMATDSTASLLDGRFQVDRVVRLNHKRSLVKGRIIGPVCLRLHVYVREHNEDYLISARIVGNCRPRGIWGDYTAVPAGKD